jgi:diguanylate cyclase (GGDEF)-like protein/PAS domain S-box-containing protein
MLPFPKTHHSPQLYRLILDHALDSFVAIDERSLILEWSKQAEETFGWTRDEVLGLPLTETIIPERYHAAHWAGIRRYLQSNKSNILGRRVELVARRKDGSEIPVELTVTPITEAERLVFSASLRDISKYRALETALRHQEAITQSILESMADAVAVADLSERMLLINPAAQRLWNIAALDDAQAISYHRYQLFQSDGKTLCPEDERPMSRALRGEQVNDWIGFVRHEQAAKGIWISINARPLVDKDGTRIGAVSVYHDITELRQREQALASQTRVLHEQVSLLEVTRDAVLARDCSDVITYWNRSAERLYGFSKEEAIGQNSHALLKTRYPVSIDEIMSIVHEQHQWEGELTHESKSGQKIIVSSVWILDTNKDGACRYLETNTDITQRIQMERVIRQTQENYRLLVETSTEVAMIITDPDGIIVNWNIGGERILGMSQQEAVGHPISSIFTPEDRSSGQPWHELEKARSTGRAEDRRWHIRKDGSRFWADGVVMPLWSENGSLRGFTKILRDQTDHQLAVEKTQFLANHDMLTGLPNRVHFSSRLHQAIALSDRNHIPLAVLLLDLDRFKFVNDTFGHHAGDLLLKEVAQRLRSSLRETDFVARLGGDEFVVIQNEVSQPRAAETLAGKLIEELGRPYQLEQHEVQSGTSIGISTYPADAKNTVELMKRSDLALYRAKSKGRGTYHFYTADLFTEKSWKKDREQRLGSALANHEFELYYQPQVDLNNWKISTVEALLRWQATDQDLVLPSDFLEVAEENGTIVEIGKWALRKACHQLKQWQNQGMPELRMSVNCSARQFIDPEFVKMVGPILDETGLAGSFLELEIAESMLARPEIKDQLVALRALGVRITIDNYGTGATALTDLKQLEVDGLKIDKTFVQHLPHRSKDAAITSSIINLAHNLRINVSAGGVETPEQLAYLKSKDCHSAQGFIFSPPIPASKFEELMLSGHWSRINRLPSLEGKMAFKDWH